MEHKEQILFRRLLKKNGFVKSDTSNNKDLMEFTKNSFYSDDFICVYTYDIVEVYFGVIFDYKVSSIKHFAELYFNHTKKEFLTS
jgi:hypothetical protein